MGDHSGCTTLNEIIIIPFCSPSCKILNTCNYLVHFIWHAVSHHLCIYWLRPVNQHVQTTCIYLIESATIFKVFRRYLECFHLQKYVSSRIHTKLVSRGVQLITNIHLFFVIRLRRTGTEPLLPLSNGLRYDYLQFGDPYSLINLIGVIKIIHFRNIQFHI